MRLASALAFGLLAACATPGDRHGRAEELARAERAFAASAATAGVKAAFLGALADDATIFRPGPVDAKAFIAARPESPFRLEWQPQRIAVSTSDDLGWSTGPYRLTLDARPGEPLHGQFFSIWRRGAGGRWQVLVDQGSGHPDPLGWTAPFEAIDADGSQPTRPVDAAEADFARVADADGLAAAYRGLGATRLRLLRDDSAPLDRADAAGDARWTWTATDSGVSRAGDFAWTMGRYRSPLPSSGFYVRVWQVERGDWKILGDVLAPVDEPAR